MRAVYLQFQRAERVLFSPRMSPTGFEEKQNQPTSPLPCGAETALLSVPSPISESAFLWPQPKGLLHGLLNSSFGMSIGAECTCLSWAAAMCVLWVRAEMYNAWRVGGCQIHVPVASQQVEGAAIRPLCCRHCILYLQSSS